MSLDLQITPRVSEKAFAMSQADGKQVVIFNVPVTANKHAIKAAVEEQFKVSVVNIRTALQTGKAIRTIRLGSKRGRPGMGKRADSKKAYVTLAADSRIAVFDEPKKEAKK